MNVPADQHSSAANTALSSSEPVQPVVAPNSGKKTIRWEWWAYGITLAVILAIAVPVSYRYWAQSQRAAFKRQCREAVSRKKWDELLARAQAWHKWEPRNDDALVFLAQAAAELKQMPLAVESLGSVSDTYKGALQALAFRAEMQFSDLNRPFDAEATWLRMIRIQPRADLPRQRLIYFYALTLQRHKLVAQLEESIRLGCEPPEAYTYLIMKDTLNFSDGLAQTTRWRLADPDNEILAAAQAVYAVKQTASEMIASFASETTSADAEALFEKALERYPQNLELLALKLDRAVFEGRTDVVLSSLKQAPGSAGDDSRFWRFRGWLLSVTQQPEAAEKALLKAIELNPFDWQARWALADVLRKLQRTAEADGISRIALEGKLLQAKIFERPNARDVDEQLIRAIHAYLQKTAPLWIREAFDQRVD
ncbi:MAG TPA: hypothetical protein VFG20_19600 [Planctomycetaceae bacterium]|nr:hypothetical protein [Planctomycetaceae bacterium]